MATNQLATAVIGSGATKTMDIGGARFTPWSSSVLNPMTYVQNSTPYPVAQIAPPPSFVALQSSGGMTPAQVQASTSPITSKNSPALLAIVAIVGVLGLGHLVRTKKGRK